MAANPEGPFEMAMSHFADGRACPRPSEVRSIVSRLMGWDGQPETCKSCSNARALYITSGEALCAACREQRSVRMLSLDGLERHAAIRSEPAAGTGLMGHPIVFDSWSVNLGGFIERVRPQAVNRMMTQSPDVRVLWNHNSDLPLARSTARTMRYWKENVGVAVSIIPPAWASNHVETVGRGDVTGMSFGFRAIEDEWSMDGKIPQRDLLDMSVSEVSAVAFPAYPTTDIKVGGHSNRVAFLQRLHKTRMAR